jgi:AraC-like DNA-binding protein
MMGWIDIDKIDKIPLLLLSDMYKNCPEGGKITIQASTNRHYDSVVIRINDNSPQPLGMSLFIARQLASLHHGTVRSEYYEGQGNMVIVELPIKKDILLKQQLSQPVANEPTAKDQPSTFHIPSNIQLNIPTIELPEGVAEGNQSLGSLVQQAYNSPDHQFLQKATKCVHDHIDDSDYDRDAFAADMGASASTLYNKLRALTGKNVTVFIRDIRIQTAIKLAKDNADLRVSDIAYRVGFRDPKYFATTFKKVTGKQPKEYFDEIRRT